MKRSLLTAAFSFLSIANVFAASVGTLQVTVMDENGTIVQEAPVYIYGERKTHFVGGQDVPGTTTFTMKEGDYRISTAMIKKTGEWIDRFASNEAHVRVVPGDNASVILVLKPIRQSVTTVSYSTLSLDQITTKLARLANN